MRVVSVGFAPVKGTRHASYDAVTLDEVGPVGDRDLCFVDVERRHILRTVQNPTLVALASRWDGDELELTLPDGRRVWSAPEPTGEQVTCEYWGRPVPLRLLDGPHAEEVSTYLGRPVRLAAAPRTEVVYAAPVSVVPLASVRDLAERLDRPQLVEETARFRATVVVDGDEAYAEQRWPGRELRLGAARVRVHEPIPRCAVIDLDPLTGVPSAPVLKTIGGVSRDLHLGVDAHVTAPGVVRPGDEVELLD